MFFGDVVLNLSPSSFFVYTSRAKSALSRSQVPVNRSDLFPTNIIGAVTTYHRIAMSQYWAPRMASGIQSHSEYFSFHQQRRLLLETLANEEARREHIANMLEVNKIKLSAAQSSGESTRLLKKSGTKLRRKLMSSQNTEKCVAQNLAVISARMNYLEQTQWRRATFDHELSLDYGQLDGLTAGMQGMVVSPIASGFPTAQDTSGLVSSMSPMFVHPWTSGHPAHIRSYQVFSLSTMSPQPYSFPLEQTTSQPPASNTFGYGDGPDSPEMALQIDTTTSSLRCPVQDFVPARRTLSMPDISTAQSVSSDNTCGDKYLEGNSFRLTRQLSLVNQPGSGPRMQRMFS